MGQYGDHEDDITPPACSTPQLNSSLQQWKNGGWRTRRCPGKFFSCLFFSYLFQLIIMLFKLQTHYYDEILLLRAANELHQGIQANFRAKRRRMSFAQVGFFFVFFLLFPTNYNTYILGYKPRDTTSSGRKQATSGSNDDRCRCDWASR